ncbi:MAG: HipA domain-containing protein [bacterium]
MSTDCLHIFVDGEYAGDLRRSSDGGLSLRYDDQWLRNEGAPVSLRFPTYKQIHTNESDSLYNFLDNLLPENTIVRKQVAERFSHEVQSTNPFELLKAVGEDCPGALQFVPEGESPRMTGEKEPVGDEDLVKEIHRLMNQDPQHPMGMNERFRFSLAGQQAKTALLYEDGQWYRPQGGVPTTHILKPPIVSKNVKKTSANEYFCMRFAYHLGLQVPNVDLHSFDDIWVLIVERFDRIRKADRIHRIHQEDLCQALGFGPNSKYEHPRDNKQEMENILSHPGPSFLDCLQIAGEGQNPRGDQRRFLSAQVLFWLLGATDGHAKNFSIQYNNRDNQLPGNAYHLAPLYDILSEAPRKYRHESAGRSQMYSSESTYYPLRLAMSVGAEPDLEKRCFLIDKLSPEDFIEMSSVTNLTRDEIQSIFVGLDQKIDKAIQHTMDDLPDGFPSFVSEQISNHVKKQQSVVNEFLD